ncbi:MAG: sodium:solute symporter family protein [Candidatus Saliniplasma sp.]
MSPYYLFLGLGIWTLFGVLIANYAKRHLGIGMEDFFLANRKIGGFVSAMTYSATTFSAFMMIGLVGLVYETGVGAFGFEMTYLMFTVLLLGIFAPRFWSIGKRYNYLTPSEMLSDRYEDDRVGMMSTMVFLIMLIPYASIQMMGAGFLFYGLTGGQVPYMVGVIVMAAFSGFAALWAGMRSVSWTDAFQSVTMLISALILLFYIFYYIFEGPVSFFSTISSQNPELLRFTWSFKMFIGLSLPWAFFALTNPQVSQRMFVSKDVKSLKRMIIFFSLFAFIYTIITSLFGFAIANHIPGLAVADEAMPTLLSQVPTVLAVIIFVGIFAAASSTLGSVILTLSSMTTRDLAQPLGENLSEKQQLFIGKVTIIVLIIVCILFASLRLELIAVLSAMASGGLLVTAPALVGTFFWKKGTSQGALVSMLVGGLVTGSMFIFDLYPLGWWPSIWGFMVTIILYIGVSLFTSPPESAEEFLETVDKEMEKHGF